MPGSWDGLLRDSQQVARTAQLERILALRKEDFVLREKRTSGMVEELEKRRVRRSENEKEAEEISNGSLYRPCERCPGCESFGGCELFEQAVWSKRRQRILRPEEEFKKTARPSYSNSPAASMVSIAVDALSRDRARLPRVVERCEGPQRIGAALDFEDYTSHISHIVLEVSKGSNEEESGEGVSPRAPPLERLGSQKGKLERTADCC